MTMHVGRCYKRDVGGSRKKYIAPEDRITTIHLRTVTEVKRHWIKQLRHGLDGGLYDRGVHLIRMHSLNHGYGEMDGHYVSEITHPCQLEVLYMYGYNWKEFSYLIGKVFSRKELKEEEHRLLSEGKTCCIEEVLLDHNGYGRNNGGCHVIGWNGTMDV